jgi:hypothetical protein
VPMSHLSMCLQQAISALVKLCGFARQADAGAATHASNSIAAVSALILLQGTSGWHSDSRQVSRS